MTESNGTPDETPQPGYWEQQAAQDPAQDPAQSPPPPYQQPGYPAYQGYSPYVGQDHPKATTSLVLGLVGLIGGLMCGLPVLVSPFAWVVGARTRREIRQSNGQLGGDGSATAGMVLGIIGTVLLALLVILVVVLIIVAVNDPTAFDDSSNV